MSTRRLLQDRSAASAAEFALVLPLLILLLLGIIDAGRWMWTYNQAEKATQAGARVAAVTQIIPGGIAVSWVGQSVNGVFLTQGDVIPASALGTISCTKPSNVLGCACTGTCPLAVTPINSAGWDAIVARMKLMYPTLTDANVEVDYRGSGLGYAGDPGGLDISPLITVKLTGLSFNALVFASLKNVSVPPASTTLTAEDELGTQSN